MLGSLPITPGGLGIVELGLTSLLVGFGGGQAEVVAAVLVYRFLTIVPTLLLGMAAAATWRRHHPGETGALERPQYDPTVAGNVTGIFRFRTSSRSRGAVTARPRISATASSTTA